MCSGRDYGTLLVISKKVERHSICSYTRWIRAIFLAFFKNNNFLLFNNSKEKNLIQEKFHFIVQS